MFSHTEHCGESGQSTVEAAFIVPVVMLLLLLMLQPGILLYDRTVMRAAAAEGCRLMATNSSSDYAAIVKPYVLRKLGAIPQQDNFHVHSGGCTWDVTVTGDETASSVSVAVKTEVKPLPLLGAGAALLGMTNSAGNIVLEVTESLPTQPDWVWAEQGGSPSGWPGAWES